MTKSSHSKSIVDYIKRSLFNYDLTIERIKSDMKLSKEKMEYYYGSSKKSDISAFQVAKIELENQKVFLSRVKGIKKALLCRVGQVVKKYEGNYSRIFMDFFFYDKTDKEISEKYNMRLYDTQTLLYKMSQDLIYITKKEQ